jgi:hypothetical protein
MDAAAIKARFGPGGIRDFVPSYGRIGAITDDTQMTLFTAEGLLRSATRLAARGVCYPPMVVHHAYLRWLKTQGSLLISHRWFELPSRYGRLAHWHACAVVEAVAG